MATPSPPGNGQSVIDSDASGRAGNVQDGGPGLKLGLVVGVPVAAFVVLVLVIVLVLWKMGKLKRSRCNEVRRRSKDVDAALREERKKSIIIIAPKGKKGAELYIARHYYEAEDENQLTLHTGRIVEVQEKLDDGWWRGLTGDQEGWFPATFVKKIDVSDPNCSLPHSLSSTLESNRRPLPPPTTKAPVDRMLSDESGYINVGYVMENRSVVDGVVEAEKPVVDTEVEADRDIDARLSTMETDDIECYLNEIFTVEDEVTPDVQRRSSFNKVKLQKRSKDSFHKDTNQKKLKDEQNEKMLKEKSQKMDKNKSTKNGSQTIVNGKPPKSKKSSSSPLINPMHYMISSSESLISTGSFNDELEKPSRKQVAKKSMEVDIIKSKIELDVKVSDDGEGRPHDGDDAYRGTPDGSSMVGVLPDGHKEFTLERDLGTEGDLDTTDDSVFTAEDDDYEKVAMPSKLSLATHLKHQLTNRTSGKRPLYVSMYPFSPDDPNQLNLCRNDVIYSLGLEENGWMKGEKKCSGEIGWFPLTYVREGQSPPGADMASEESEGFDSEFEDEENITGLEYEAIYPYTAQQEGDLTFNYGDTIIVMERLDNGWWRGCLGDQDGWFPGTYVEPVPVTPGSPSLYEEIASPTNVAVPLSTSSPIERDATDSLAYDSPGKLTPSKQRVLSSAPVIPGDDNPYSTRISSPGDQRKKYILPPLSFKPHVPRRFITPKIVAVPKRKHSSRKLNKKPSRPPPPVPKGDANYYSTVFSNGVPVSNGLIRTANGNKTEESDFGEKRRRSVPRPKAPPPPVPGTPTEAPNGGVPFVFSVPDNVPLREQGSRSEETFNTVSVNNTDYDDVVHSHLHQDNSKDNKRKTSKFDSGLELESSLPGVHTSARTDHKVHTETGTKTKSTGAKLKENIHDSANQSLDATGDSKIEQTGSSDNSLSFGAIMNIFERIVHKADDGVGDSGGSHSAYDDSIGALLKPPIPPKPEQDQLQFRRSQSEPDLLNWKTTSSLSLIETDLNSELNHKLLEGVTQEESSTDHDAIVLSKRTVGLKYGAQKPSLPPRPKVPPQRSKSLGTLLNIPTNLSSAISDTNSLSNSTDSTPSASVRIKDKPEKPPLPVAMLYSSSSREPKIHMAAKTPHSVHSDSAHITKQQNDRISKIENQYKKSPKPNISLPSVLTKSKPITSSARSENTNSSNSVGKDNQSRPIRNRGSEVKISTASSRLATSTPIYAKSTNVKVKSDAVMKVSPNNTPPSRPAYSPTKSPTKEPTKQSAIIQPHQVPLSRSTTSNVLGNDLIHNQVKSRAGSSPQHAVSNMSPRQKIISNGSLKHTSPPAVRLQPCDSGDSEKDLTYSGITPHDTLKVDVGAINTSMPDLSPVPPPLPTSPPPDLSPPILSPAGGVNSAAVPRALHQPHLEEPPPLRRVISPVNIRTSPLRFFTPMGYSRSGSISSLSSGTTLSPLTLSPVSSMDRGHSTDDYNTAMSSLKSDSDFDSLPRFMASRSRMGLSHTLDRDHRSRREPTRAVSPVSPNRSPTSSEKLNPMRFYTPAAFVPRREQSLIDSDVKPVEEHIPVNGTSTTMFSSEQHLSPESVDDIEKYGSTGSLNYPSSKLYQPYASVEVKQTEKRTLTPPKPFVPSTWSAHRSTDKLPMAMVDIDIDDAVNVSNNSNKGTRNQHLRYDSLTSSLVHPSVYILDNKLLKGEYQGKSGTSPHRLLAQRDLESDV